jgi:hypothetical protein
MFTPDHERSADEMMRVCRPGGRIALANWTPTGFIGRMFKIVGAHVPPPAGVPSPLMWGTEERVRELLGSASRIDFDVHQFVFRYESADDFFDTFRTYYGPVLRAWDALDEPGRESFRSQLVALCDECNESTRGKLAVPSDYLEIVAHVD